MRRFRTLLAAPVHLLRRNALLYWLAILVFICVVLGAWVLTLQPTNGRAFTADDYAFVALFAFGLIYLLFFDMRVDEARAMGGQLSRSKLSGVLVTLTFLVLVFWLGEGYLRAFYITTDGFGFTAMNYWWYQNFGYANPNSLGYRDDEPSPDAETRIAVVGDSFAMGHGINDRDAVFAHRLETMLNADGGGQGGQYEVNLIARSGMDTDVEMYTLDQYPYRPDIVVLSYYLNDIDWLLAAPEQNPDNLRFAFPQNRLVAGFVRDFFLPNFVYYNLLQFTSTARTGNHTLDLVNAHMDDALWARQAQLLFEITLWCRDHDARLIVLLWPHITQIEDSQPAVQRVAAFFAEQGVQVVNMTNILRGQDSRAMIVNRFDTHPSAAAHELAAQALYEAIRNP